MGEKTNGENVAGVAPSLQQRWHQEPQSTGSDWWIWLLATVVVCLAAIGGYLLYKNFVSKSAPPAPTTRPIPVVAATAREGDMDLYLNGLGTVTPLLTVTLKTRVDGQIISMPFSEGQIVHQGDLLVQIDPRPYQAALELAKGQLARDQAMLNGAQKDLARYRSMDPAARTQQQVDDQAALVDQDQGIVELDKANIDAAQLNVEYASVRSTLTGRIGLRLVDPGNIVHASDTTGLVVITQLQPITLVFSLPEDDIPRVMKRMAEAQAANEPVQVDAYDRNLKNKIATGSLAAIDSQIDPTSGTLRMKASFQNDDNSLYPNQFVNARLLVQKLKKAVIVPAAAVQRSPTTTFVYVVKLDKTVEMRDVKVGPTEGDQTVIKDKLSAGEVVVIDNVDKLQPGNPVTVGKGDKSSTPAADTTQPLEAQNPNTPR